MIRQARDDGRHHDTDGDARLCELLDRPEALLRLRRLFVPAGLLSLVDYPDTTQEAWEVFVSGPAKNVYERPLGDL